VGSGLAGHPVTRPSGHHGGGCPGTRLMSSAPSVRTRTDDETGTRQSRLGQWPVQLRLVPADAPFFENADLLIAADCVPFAYADFHKDFLDGKVLLIGCPKLDDNEYYAEKLTDIFRNADIRSITVARMEVPCCGGIEAATKRALVASGKNIPCTVVTIGVKGELR
jgi:hypothetical protein